MKTITNLFNSALHLFYPHNCEGCSTDVLENDHLLCAKCYATLAETGFMGKENNPVEKTFYGRLQVEEAGAAYYFTQDSIMQKLIFALKYNGNKDVGLYLGKQLGKQVLQSRRFNNVDILVPLPLNAKRQFKRGYNQAELICNGIADVINKPINTKVVLRSVHTTTQTQQSRMARWQNMKDVFDVDDLQSLEGKHILLVDDVVTTGATLEACGTMLLNIKDVKLSIVTVAYTVL